MSVERIEQRIYLIRGHKVMLSGDLAILYGGGAASLDSGRQAQS